MTGIPDDAFDDLMLRWLAGELDQLEERRLAKWLNSSPQHRRRFDQLAAVWSLEPPQSVEPRSVRPNPAFLIRRAESRRTRTRVRRRLVAGTKTWGAAAAAMLLTATVIQTWRSEPAPGFTSAEFTTRDDGDASLRLDDGSTVHLAQGSTLRLEPHPSGRYRDVHELGVHEYLQRRIAGWASSSVLRLLPESPRTVCPGAAAFLTRGGDP